MRKLTFILLGTVLASAPAFASNPASASKPTVIAQTTTTAPPIAGLLKAGYTNVSALTKDDKGVWRGTAMKGGKSVKVGVDFKGNVTEG